jgi:hypothetical protein
LFDFDLPYWQGYSVLQCITPLSLLRVKAMPVKATVEGIEQLTGKLTALIDKVAKRVDITVSYNTPYALIVHEDTVTPKTWSKPGSGPEWLSRAYKENRFRLTQIVVQALRAGKTLYEAELEAAQFILAESKIRCPVDTGRLINSGKVVTRG